MLPLFLTISHHNIRRRKLHRKPGDAGVTKEAAPQLSQDVQIFNSELILWKVSPVFAKKAFAVERLISFRSIRSGHYANRAAYVNWHGSIVQTYPLSRAWLGFQQFYPGKTASIGAFGLSLHMRHLLFQFHFGLDQQFSEFLLRRIRWKMPSRLSSCH